MKALTIGVHTGEHGANVQGAVCFPIFQSANYLSSSEHGHHDMPYIRLNNTPNHEVINQKLAALEQGEAALVCGSGMAAISSSLLSVLLPGNHLLAQPCLYGGTLGFFHSCLKEMDISVSFIDSNDPNSWQKELRPKTKAIYVESISNPLTEVGALDKIPSFAKAHGLISIIDNTVATPFYFRPLTLGFDLVVHSATKYLNGHSDIVAGAVIGSRSLVSRIKHKLDHLGGALDPHACFLLNRGLKTFALRMEQHQKNAQSLAKFLEEHPKVSKVSYPGLLSHPNHERAKTLFSGYSGLLSFELPGDTNHADSVIKRLKWLVSAASLGGVESLITRPVTTSHAGLSAEELKRIGISDTLIRVSAGIEHTEDLIEDFIYALA